MIGELNKIWMYQLYVIVTNYFIINVFLSEAKMPVNLCKPNPCMNDGMCILSGGSFRCQCQGYEGPHCETSQYH